MSNNRYISIIGIQGVFSTGWHLTDESLLFYEQFFSRAREIENTWKTVRFIGYGCRFSDRRELVFIGVEVNNIDSIPAGMAAWVLDEGTWEILEQGGNETSVTMRKDITWRWKDTGHKGDKRFTGEFCVQGSCNNEFGMYSIIDDVHLTAHAYTDLQGKIDGGDRVNLVDNDPSWPRQYAMHAEYLKELVGDKTIIRLEHYGSTAIPGMPAKPVIDILAEVSSFDEARRVLIPLLNSPEWEYWWNNDHMVFIRRERFMGKRICHLHVAPGDHRLWNQVAFRDYLIAHEDAAARYKELKRRYAESYAGDRERYTRAKGDFVREIVDKAKKEK